MNKFKSQISGSLDIIVDHKEEEFEGVVEKWDEILIHGDPDGLKSFAKLLISIAELDQEAINDLPEGAREHIHLRPNWELSNSSCGMIVGRLDAKGTGKFYDGFIPKKVNNKNNHQSDD